MKVDDFVKGIHHVFNERYNLSYLLELFIALDWLVVKNS